MFCSGRGPELGIENLDICRGEKTGPEMEKKWTGKKSGGYLQYHTSSNKF